MLDSPLQKNPVQVKKVSEYLSCAKEAARITGEVLKQHVPSALSSDGKDIKISADKAAHACLVDALKNTDIPVLSEEGKMCAVTDCPIWIIDPLDGSMNFLRGIPLCAISIALMVDKEPVLGVVYDFIHGEMFTGVVGEDAWLNEHSIHTSNTSNKRDAIIMTGFPSYTEYSTAALTTYITHIQLFKKVRLIGSASLSLAYVASGRADAYYEKDIKIWDVAAGLAIVKAAGGVYEVSPIGDDGKVTVDARNAMLT